MGPTSVVERYLASIRYETERRRTPQERRARLRHPAITISRQAGAGAHGVADAIVAELEPKATQGSPRWTVFDRNLVETVLRDHDLPGRLARFMPEDRIDAVADAIDELFGLHPASSVLVRKTASSILRLAEIGNVVIIGRAANLVTASVDTAFHVRLVGSLERRIARVQGELDLTPEKAAEYVRAQDVARTRYVKRYYGKDIADPLQYHLVINTDRMSPTEAARVISDAVAARSRDRRPPV